MSNKLHGRRQLHSTQEALDGTPLSSDHDRADDERYPLSRTEGINGRTFRAPDGVKDAVKEESRQFANSTTVLDATIGSQHSHERVLDDLAVGKGYRLAKIYAYGKSARGEVHHPDDLVIQQALQSAKRGNAAGTIQALKLLPHERLDGSDLSVLKIASLLLRQSKRGGGQYESSSAIVAALSGIGMTLNLAMFNVLILNAAETNDPATAWRIYNLLHEQEVKPDDYTHTILLSMCRRLGDKATYKRLYHELDPENLSYSPVLLTEIMACRYHFNARQNMGHVLRFYELHFWMQPLRALEIVNQGMERILRERPRNENIVKQYPAPATIGLMIRVHSRQTQRHAGTRLVYNSFQTLIRAEEPLIMPLLATTHTYNAFMKALFRNPLRLRSSPLLKSWGTVFNDMVRAVPSHIIDETTGLPLVQAKPDLQTFNIILNAKMKLGLIRSARRTWKRMHRGQLDPDLVSWNTFLQGYAKDQRVEGVVKILLQMISAGLEPDKNTYIALHDVEDQELLEKMLTNPLESDKVFEAASKGTLGQFPELPWHSAKRSKVTRKTMAQRKLSPVDERRYRYLMRYVRQAVNAQGQSSSTMDETVTQITSHLPDGMKTPWQAYEPLEPRDALGIVENIVNTPEVSKTQANPGHTLTRPGHTLTRRLTRLARLAALRSKVFQTNNNPESSLSEVEDTVQQATAPLDADGTPIRTSSMSIAEKEVITTEPSKSLSGRASSSAGERQTQRGTLIRKVGLNGTSTAEREVISMEAGKSESASVKDPVQRTSRSTPFRRVDTVGTSHKIVL